MVENKYIPLVGDIISFCDEEFIVLESYTSSGTVAPLHEAYHISNFYWGFEGKDVAFVRKATDAELTSTGLKEEN